MRQFLRFALAGMTFLGSSSFVQATPEAMTTKAKADTYVTSVPQSRAETVLIKCKVSLANQMRTVTTVEYYDMDDPSARYMVQKPGPNMSFNATKGRWMFFVVVRDFMDMKAYVIVRENVVIDGDTTLEMSDAEAVNHIAVKTILPNGEELLMNSVDDMGNMIEDGNCKDCDQTVMLFRKDTNLVRALSFGTGPARYKSEIDGDITIDGDFYISNLSENIALSVTRKCTTTDYEVYSISYDFGSLINSDRELTNGGWYKLQSAYAELPDSKIKAEDDYYQIGSNSFFDNRSMDGIGERTTYAEGGKSYSYISLPEPTMNGMDTHLYTIIHGKAVGTNGQTGAMRDFYSFICPPVTKIGGKMTHLVYPYDYLGAMATWYNKTDPLFFLGRTLYYHPRFSWVQEEDEIPVYGGSAPVTVLMMTWGDFDLNCWWLNYVGRFGEQREADKQVASAKVEQNGEEIKAGTAYEILGWSNSGCKRNPEAKDWKVTMTNENTLVDGNVASNITVSEFNTGRDDFLPPTLTMLNFRNAADKISDRFDKPEDGTLEFSATDFTPYVSADRNIWNDFNNVASVKVEYSAEDADTWRELAVAEVPELFFSPGYGGFYRGSLKDVVNNSPTSWYDLRVTIADKAGNTQTQTFSPAFRIDEQVSLDNLMADSNVTVKVEGSQITVTGASDNAVVEVYDLAGRKVVESKSLTLSLDGFMGAYVVKVTDGENVNTFKIGL